MQIYFEAMERPFVWREPFAVQLYVYNRTGNVGKPRHRQHVLPKAACQHRCSCRLLAGFVILQWRGDYIIDGS
jgi:hypothetical protein